MVPHFLHAQRVHFHLGSELSERLAVQAEVLVLIGAVLLIFKVWSDLHLIFLMLWRVEIMFLSE